VRGSAGRSASVPRTHALTRAGPRCGRWSPDGSFLATVYGFNNTSHVAPILLRGTWGSSYCDFVGHKKPVVCAVRDLRPLPPALALTIFFFFLYLSFTIVPRVWRVGCGLVRWRRRRAQKFNPVLFVDADSKKGKRSTLSYCAVGNAFLSLSLPPPHPRTRRGV
jgi:hypothetical protein